MTDYLNTRALAALQAIASTSTDLESREIARKAMLGEPHILDYTLLPWRVSRSAAGELEPFTVNGIHLLKGDGSTVLPLVQRQANAAVIQTAPQLLRVTRGVIAALEPASPDRFDGHSISYLRIVILQEAKQAMKEIEEWEDDV